ncbi:MAG: 50S ribosomal protein L24 [Nitrososphaeria archaeon]|nr:50S ribosomal protein L24 [Nitrososphaeria archaeon]
MASTKPSKVRKRILNAPWHIKNKMLNARLSDELRSKYDVKTVRVRKGDSVKIVRGEFAGVEGKVTSIDLKTGRITVEGVFRENIRGEQVPVKIHASKVIITSLNLEDKLRKEKLESKAKRVEVAQ